MMDEPRHLTDQECEILHRALAIAYPMICEGFFIEESAKPPASDRILRINRRLRGEVEPMCDTTSWSPKKSETAP